MSVPALAATAPPLPRRRGTSAARPEDAPPSDGHAWDRVRFTGPARAGRRNTDDAAADLRPPTPPVVQGIPREDPEAWCGSLVRAAVEVLTGGRPTAQLARWLTADIYETLARRAGLAVRIHGRPGVVRQAVVRRVHLCAISPTAAEASVVVHDGERVRAAAVRIEAHRGRWRATALEIG